jgi:hypothetical protein
VQLGCCLALVIVPLLLLATPQRATLHDPRHHAGAARGRGDETLTRLTTSWTTPVDFVGFVDHVSRPMAPVTGPAPSASRLGPHVVNVSFRQLVPTTTTTAAPPTTSFRPVTAGAVSVAVDPAPKPPAPTAKPVVAPPPPPVQHAMIGLASWYGAPAGTCASPTLAFGTVVTVTDVSTGASVRCLVDDREAHNPGRVIDLSPATFSELARLAAGVFEVRLSW